MPRTSKDGAPLSLAHPQLPADSPGACFRQRPRRGLLLQVRTTARVSGTVQTNEHTDGSSEEGGLVIALLDADIDAPELVARVLLGVKLAPV